MKVTIARLVWLVKESPPSQTNLSSTRIFFTTDMTLSSQLSILFSLGGALEKQERDAHRCDRVKVLNGTN